MCGSFYLYRLHILYSFDIDSIFIYRALKESSCSARLKAPFYARSSCVKVKGVYIELERRESTSRGGGELYGQNKRPTSFSSSVVYIIQSCLR